MNILFISALPGSQHAGPTYSVPQQIISEMDNDNIYWVNLQDAPDISVFDSMVEYHYCDCKSFHLENLPEPFNKPDLVVLEEFFKIEYINITKKIWKNKVPYIIVPRCQMTEKYLLNKRLKKIVANKLFYNKIAKKALAVQFLTEQEFEDSKVYYTGKSFIVANGINIPKIDSKEIDENEQSIKGLFIGRYNVWQKGLDILAESVSRVKSELKNNNVKIFLYGPDSRSGSRKDVEELVKKYDIEDIVTINGPIFGEEKKSILCNADFFIHTSRFEGLPMSVLEAMSYGLPCLVTNGTNVRVEIENTDAGWGADDNSEAVENALKKLVKDFSEKNSKGENALSLAKKYSWNRIAKKWHEEVKGLLEKKN